MKALLTIILLISTTAAAEAQCRMMTRATKSGGTMRVCIDDKYSTCMQNNMQGGWTQQEAKGRCDRLKASGAVK